MTRPLLRTYFTGGPDVIVQLQCITLRIVTNKYMV